ncbi:MAG: hypothetical protein CME91_02925 [Hyphomonadaceae bacterium]|nr:hypothetical protein [Hyphomonadaceae bacterium]|tara:strand:+ start:509313 stop:509867 length:555 start_codon:yes stop_codon:yes gene_type:complete
MVLANVDPVALVARAKAFGFRLATRQELEAAVSMAETLIHGKLASVDSISRMNAQTGMTAWVTGDPVDGIFLILPLTEAGENAVRDGSYDPAAPRREHLAVQGEGVSAFYVGVYAGKTREARKKIMTASAVLRVEMFGVFPAYARGATEDGRRSMLSLGFQKFEGGLSDLYVQPPFQQIMDHAS